MFNMLKITPEIKLEYGGKRVLSALINYLEDQYLIETWNRPICTSIFYTENQVNILKKAAYLQYELWRKQTTETFKDIFGKEQTFYKEDLLTFADNLNGSTLTVYYLPKKKENKLTKERLQFMYIDCIDKLYELAIFKKAKWEADEYRKARKINHYRQLLENNRSIWDYLKVEEGLTPAEFNNKYDCNYSSLFPTLYLDPKLSIKELVYKAKIVLKLDKPSSGGKPSVIKPPERTIEWELEQYAKHRINRLKELKAFSNQYKITITDEATGDVVQEFYLPKN